MGGHAAAAAAAGATTAPAAAHQSAETTKRSAGQQAGTAAGVAGGLARLDPYAFTGEGAGMLFDINTGEWERPTVHMKKSFQAMSRV